MLVLEERSLIRRRSASPSNASVFQILLDFPIELTCHADGVNARQISIAPYPFGGPALPWIHDGALTFKECRRAEAASFWIFHLECPNEEVVQSSHAASERTNRGRNPA